MSLHGTTGNGVSKVATPQGSATAHMILPSWTNAYPTARSRVAQQPLVAVGAGKAEVSPIGGRPEDQQQILGTPCGTGG